MIDGQLDRLLAGWVESRIVSAAVAVVASERELLAVAGAGWRSVRDRKPVEKGDFFDAGSLTKPWVATLALRLDENGGLALETPIGDLFPKASRALARQPLENLLRHRSGLAPWSPLSQRLETARSKERLLEALLDPSLMGHPAGTYSDLGYMLWGLAAERATGRSLSTLLAREVAAPLGVRLVVAPVAPSRHPVECRLDCGREQDLARRLGVRLAPWPPPRPGEPFDANARFLVRRFRMLPAHSGLFLRIDELVTLAREWLRPSKLLSRAVAKHALSGPRGAYALGWARRSRDGSSGLALSKSSFGHTGYPGATLWIDPARRRIYALLAHRIDSRADFNRHRREFHRIAAKI